MDAIIAVLIIILVVSAGVGWAFMLIAGILGTSIGFGSAWAIGLLTLFAYRLLSASGRD